MPPKSERFELRVDEELLDQIDAWRRNEDGTPSRADAVRQLVSMALSQSRREKLVFSDGERLIVSMLCDMLKHQKVDQNYNPDLIQSALYGGHLWSLKWQYEWLFHAGEDGDAAVKHVVDVLDMWRFIESAYSRLSVKDKKALAEAVPYGGNSPQFSGYDGNNESEYLGIVRHLVDVMGRFSELKGRELNSHGPRVRRYSAMLSEFLPIRHRLHDGVELGVKELTAILTADD